ncbi:MAG TPA: hypothetical protein VMW94_10360 [Actinomycetes bacterium]|nr:hypothetical protein [Actinomycetes bacterium]
MIDPLGYILTTIRDDATVAALTTKIRGGEPAPGDALGAGSYQRFVVLVSLGYLREKRLPIQEVRIAARCYGLTHQDAAALAGAVSDSIHALSPRISSGDVGIWSAFDDGGGGGLIDPDTSQPYYVVMILANAATTPIV